MQNEITTPTEDAPTTTQAPEPKAKKSSKRSATPEIATTSTDEPAPTNPEAPAPKTKKGKKKGPPEIATIETASEGYLGWMERDGASGGTVASYTQELRMAADELGRDTKIADLTVERVAEYFACKRLTKLKSGRLKSKPTVDKSRRVFRQMLVWCVNNGWIESAPLPEAK